MSSKDNYSPGVRMHSVGIDFERHEALIAELDAETPLEALEVDAMLFLGADELLSDGSWADTELGELTEAEGSDYNDMPHMETLSDSSIGDGDSMPGLQSVETSSDEDNDDVVPQPNRRSRTKPEVDLFCTRWRDDVETDDDEGDALAPESESTLWNGAGNDEDDIPLSRPAILDEFPGLSLEDEPLARASEG
ncbi:hypothetical protein HGRIS_002981 [Hohenbuehelia grisea]|uniref:Uncharacterized protein n=1 Tax=Hohenbuehelia grisea TaxID=104357 RepID=A0ABR3JNJ7_9AGAR